jgi:hypothetical protein
VPFSEPAAAVGNPPTEATNWNCRAQCPPERKNDISHQTEDRESGPEDFPLHALSLRQTCDSRRQGPMQSAGDGTPFLYNRPMRRCTIVVLLFVTLSAAQDRSAWQSLSQLQAGDKVKLSLKAHGSITGIFQSSTPDQVTVASTIARREEVAKLERYNQGGWSRGKTALVGAAIGGGAGAIAGVAAAGCNHNSLGPCISRGEGGAVAAAAGAVLGAIVGALLPHHRTELIYAAK